MPSVLIVEKREDPAHILTVYQEHIVGQHVK